MKIKTTTPFLPFFVVFLLVGFWTGRQIAVSAQQPGPVENGTERPPIVELDSAPSTPTPQAPAVTEALPPVPSLPPPTQPAAEQPPKPSQLASRQRNLLVIGVDDLGSPDPRLEAVWLVIYMPANPHFMLLPVYPSPSSALQEANSPSPDLAQLFHLNASKTLPAEFLSALEGRGLWWTGFLILDEVALSDVIEFLGGAGELSSLDGARTIASLPPAANDPQEALIRQARLLHELCGNVARLSLDDGWRLPHLFGLIPAHAITDLDLDQVATEWQQLLQRAGEIACEYPSLAQTNYHP
ncbi:MAG TPA: hypothetical protein VJL34_13560 [Anaerolineales bacterium]|nr:hypothetical protein [Anaerolineales bacterium]